MSTIRSLRAQLGAFFDGLTGGGRGWILLLVSAGWFLSLGVRIVYPALLPSIAAEFEITYATAGVLVGVLWICYALLQFPGGVLADRFGERIVLVASVSITLLAVGAVMLSPILAAFVVATALLGIGTGLYGTTRITVLSAVFPERDTTAISVSQASGNVGNVILPVAASFVAVSLGWRWGFGYLLPFFAAIAAGFWIFVPRRASGSADDNESFRLTIRRALAAIPTPSVLLATATLCLLMFIYQGVTGFLPTYLVETKGLTSSRAATLFGLFFASAIFVQFVSGVASDRYGPRLALGVFTGLSAPAFGLLTVAGSLGELVASIVLLSCVLGAMPPMHAYAVRALPPSVQGTGYGLLRTFYIAFGAGAPPLVGFLADTGRFDRAFLLLGGVAVAALVVSVLLPTLE